MPTVTAANAADFLAVVPHLVGFEPRNSIVFVAFRGRRTCGALRFDLPRFDLPGFDLPGPAGSDDAGRRLHKRVATTLVGTLSKLQGVDAVVPVVFTDEGFGGSGPPREHFVAAVAARLEFSGFTVRDALCVASDGWGSYLDDRCPAEGRPLAAIERSGVLDGLSADALRPLGDVAGWAALPDVGAIDCERVAKLVLRFAALVDGTPGCPIDPRVARAIGLPRAQGPGDVPSTLEAILRIDPGRIEPAAAAFVIAVVRSPALRDVVMLQWAFDLETGERVLADAHRFALGAPADALPTAGLMLGRGPRPDPARVETAISLIKTIAALAPRRARPPLLCMLAWLNWALGRSSVANEFVCASEAIDADYSLAEVLRMVLERGILPEWAFAGG
ncbi:hypothetical protein GCM10027413_22920 [Conyzicola nivalis]|uniref:DUF4192 domain-containing protein n=1 Tax=Conyzicola nivalis TaxID=1477021 RepID=A0A916SC86_9MICO|nr:DUF4192 family protein [Conyzicola nivalis]GGA92338.1 hypothetical protein GCM10010979_03700 [Conyzicola nivalis]